MHRKPRNSVILSNDFGEIEDHIKNLVLISHASPEDSQVKSLVNDYRNLYERVHLSIMTKDIWESTALFAWLIYHQVFHEIQRDVSLGG